MYQSRLWCLMVLFYYLARWIVCTLATEAITEIIVDSKLFKPLHSRVAYIAYPPNAPPPDTRKRRFFAWFGSMIGCGYCLSVWVAAWLAVYLPMYWTPSPLPDWRRMDFWYLIGYSIWYNLAMWSLGSFALHRL